MTPIVARFEASVPLWGSGPGSNPSPRRRQSFSLIGIRAEQLRRAAILQKAAKGPAITMGNAKAVVERLARVVPGMRYKVGPLIYATLAPATAEIYAPHGDALPGRPAGRPVNWTPEYLEAMRAWVEARMAEAGESDATNALLAFGDMVVAERNVHLSLKALNNRLAEARRAAK